MIVYHCWVAISYHAHDTDLTLQANCIENCINYLATHEYLTADKYKVVQCNEISTFLASGCHKRDGNYIIEIFEWIGRNAPGSYGLLYFHDDKDPATENTFNVFVMKKGKVIQQMDTFFSPVIPTIEDEYDETRGD